MLNGTAGGRAFTSFGTIGKKNQMHRVCIWLGAANIRRVDIASR